MFKYHIWENSHGNIRKLSILMEYYIEPNLTSVPAELKEENPILGFPITVSAFDFFRPNQQL